MERYGIGPMATPRQADILLITGYLSVKTLKRVVRSYEQMNDPGQDPIVEWGSTGWTYWGAPAVTVGLALLEQSDQLYARAAQCDAWITARDPGSRINADFVVS